MRKNLFVRSIAAVSGIVMLASLAACGDNISSAGNNSGSTSTEKITGSFSGAGATSQQAAEEAWISAYMAANSGANVTYNPTGSGAGVTTFLSGATAWAGSDKALSDDEVTQSSDKACANGTTAFDVPVYISPIAIIFNLKGVSDAGKHINLDADTAAKIFDGKIVKWNHRQPEQGPGLARHPDHRRAPLRQVRHHAELRELLQGPGPRLLDP